jgi:hypothetical protein
VTQRWWIAVCIAGAAQMVALSGCSSLNLTSRKLPNSVRDNQWEPKAETDDPAENDKWAFVGKEGRGSRPLDDEHDPFKNLLMSPEARQIERNLGYK